MFRNSMTLYVSFFEGHAEIGRIYVREFLAHSIIEILGIAVLALLPDHLSFYIAKHTEIYGEIFFLVHSGTTAANASVFA